MSWKEEQGPWDFTPQPNKWGYLNNPRWYPQPVAPVNYDSNPEDEPQIWSLNDGSDNDSGIHYPCGHWHKEGESVEPEVPVIANLYGWYYAGTPPALWAVQFDAAAGTITYRGKYESPSGDINGLVLINDRLYVVGGTAPSDLRAIGVDPVAGILPLLATYTPFNSYDTLGSGLSYLVDGADVNKLYYIQASATGEIPHAVALTRGTYAREGRFAYGTTVEGTDSNPYVQNYVTANWLTPAFWRPITGSAWNVKWKDVADFSIDSPIVTWGVGTCYSGATDHVDAFYYSGYFYVALYKSPTSHVRRLDPVTFAILADVSTINVDAPARIKCHNGIVYTACGFSASKVISYDHISLVKIAEIVLTGRFAAANAGDIEIVGDYLVACTNNYGGDNAHIYVLDLNTLAIISSVEQFLPEAGHQRLCMINSGYVAAGSNNAISVYTVPDLTLVDSLDLSPFLPTQGGQKGIVSNIVS